jgi:hypothetical protein
MLCISSETSDAEECFVSTLLPGEASVITDIIAAEAGKFLAVLCLGDDSGGAIYRLDRAAYPEIEEGMLPVRAFTGNDADITIQLNTRERIPVSCDDVAAFVFTHIPTMLN